ncbi:hypothetical protein AB0L40_20580 [Patulibacter sp. NPDC049589]|uniref:hypothetical protein n=1 Tax=Patulibacter sp. NPDC049589 TaxID=3154731 RepID=UPI00342982B2
MRPAGNRTHDPGRDRLLMALRARDADRALEAARLMGDVPLSAAAEITSLLADLDDPRYDRAAARLAARLTLERRLGLEDADAVLTSVARLPDAEALAQLLGYCRRAA